MKFKFISFYHEYEIEELEEDFEEVSNPLPYSNLPDGEYMIRGNKKGHRKEYWKIENKWFLISTVDKDNGHYMCDAAAYTLYPQKPESFWKKLSEVHWKCLSKYWRRALYGYQFHMQLREQYRNIMKSCYRWEKELEDTTEIFTNVLKGIKDS